MAMTEQDVSSITVGHLTENCTSMLRLLKIFFNLTFKVDYEENDNLSDSDSEDERIELPPKVSLACVGVGFANLVRRMR